MLKNILPIVSIMTALILCGCTDAQMAKWSALNSPQHIKCYSGGQLIYEGNSTGKILSEEHTDGYYFEDAETHKVVEVSADCIFVKI